MFQGDVRFKLIVADYEFDLPSKHANPLALKLVDGELETIKNVLGIGGGWSCVGINDAYLDRVCRVRRRTKTGKHQKNRKK